MPGIFFCFMIAFAMAGLYSAIKVAPYVGKLLGFIWVDPAVRRRAAVLKRVKELCVDSNVPEETAVMMTASEAGVPEDKIKEVMGIITPSTMKSIIKGGVFGEILQAGLKASKKIRGS